MRKKDAIALVSSPAFDAVFAEYAESLARKFLDTEDEDARTTLYLKGRVAREVMREIKNMAGETHGTEYAA